MKNIEQVRKWCQGTWLSETDSSYPIEFLAIDSRNIDQPANTLFIALKTPARDGHEFIWSAWQKGVRNFLVSTPVETERLRGANIILVKDTLQALQHIAAGSRKQFSYPVIGITGSNGKTIVKEWLYQLLGDSYQVARSPKSYNSQIGVPLSVWLMQETHNLAIFEAGISQPAEMELLEKIILPDIGIFTNIGEAHSEGFLNRRQKINEKLVLFRHVKQLVYCLDYNELNQCVVQLLHNVRSTQADNIQLVTWSQKQEADLRITTVEKNAGKSTIYGNWRGSASAIVIPFTDDASIENAIHCWCTMLLLSVEQDIIKQGMLRLEPVSMRLELRQGINDCTVINDTYNSDLTSLQMALNYLDQQKQHSQHTVIMSDILQPGKRDMDLYEEVADLISRRNIYRFIGVGPSLYKNKSLFRKTKKLRSIFFKSTSDLLKNFHLLSFQNEAILLKGARVFAFEKIGILLEQKVHQTVLAINLSSLEHNLKSYRSLLSPGVKIMAMVKAFAYGSGSVEIAARLQYAGVDYLGVAYTDEGIALRKAGIKMPVMVMSPDDASFDRMIAWKLEPELFSFRSLHAFIGIARAFGATGYPVHIKLDTGMHRLGFGEQEMVDLAITLKDCAHIKVASIFSHLASSENPDNDSFTLEQGARFEAMSAYLVSVLPDKPIRHICNSAGAVRHASLRYDMVRLGLGLYGLEGSGELSEQLKPVSTLHTTIAQVHDVPEGDSVGYGHHTFARSGMRIATISLGYADGYARSMGNGKAYVLIHGKQARTVGSICMDMCMVDVTNIPEAREGDDVIVFGKQLSVSLLAEWGNTISYEIMTGISQRVKRVYVQEE